MEDAEVTHILYLPSMWCPYTLLHWKGNSTAKERVGVFLLVQHISYFLLTFPLTQGYHELDAVS